MKENYIVINGKKAELTDEQLKTLSIAYSYKVEELNLTQMRISY